MGALVLFWACSASAACPQGDMDDDCDIDWEDVRRFCLEWMEVRIPIIEAEDYSVKTAGSGAASSSSWVELTGEPSASGSYMYAFPDIGLTIDTNIEADSPQMSYDVDLPVAGTYYLWLKGWAENPWSQYVHYGLDGFATSSDGSDALVLSHYGYFTWQSEVLGGGRPTLTVGSAGEHTLDIWMREDGAKIDQLMVTNNPAYLPEDSEGLTADFTGDYRVDFFDYAVLARDWLVEGCIPVEDECTNWQTRHPEWIFCDGFEVDTAFDRQGRYFEYSDDGGDFIAMDGVGYNGSKGMRVLFQQNEVSAGGMKLGFGRVPQGSFDSGIRNTEDFREIYYRMYLKMQDGWVGYNPVEGNYSGKLSRATCFSSESDWSQAMIAHLWASEEYKLLVDPVRCVDPVTSEVMCEGYNDFGHMDWIGAENGITPIFDSLHDDTWYCVEAHVRLNDPGSSNGVQEFWIDGQLEAISDNLNFVASYTDYAINAILFENYWNDGDPVGDGGSPVEQERYFDSIVVSTERIGCDCD